MRIEAADARPKYSGSNVGHMLRGLVALWEKDWPEAEKDFQKVILEVPNDFVAKNNLALALVEQRRPGQEEAGIGLCARPIIKANDKTTPTPCRPWAGSTSAAVSSIRPGLALDQAIKAAGGLNNADTATYCGPYPSPSDRDWKAKEILENILKSERPFSMRPEAKKLYEKVKDAKKPAEPAQLAGSSEDALSPQVDRILNVFRGGCANGRPRCLVCPGKKCPRKQKIMVRRSIVIP